MNAYIMKSLKKTAEEGTLGNSKRTKGEKYNRKKRIIMLQELKATNLHFVVF